MSGKSLFSKPEEILKKLEEKEESAKEIFKDEKVNKTELMNAPIEADIKVGEARFSIKSNSAGAMLGMALLKNVLGKNG